MPRQQRHPPLPRPRRWRNRLARWLRGVAETLDPAPFGLDLSDAPEVWADHVRAAARRAGRTSRPPLRWRWSARRPRTEAGSRRTDVPTPTEPPRPDQDLAAFPPEVTPPPTPPAETSRRPPPFRSGPLVRPRPPRSPGTDDREPAPARRPNRPEPEPDRRGPLVRPRRDRGPAAAAPLWPTPGTPRTPGPPLGAAAGYPTPAGRPTVSPSLPAARQPERRGDGRPVRRPPDDISPPAERPESFLPWESGPPRPDPAGNQPAAAPPNPAAWRITPTPPYLPAAAVLPDGLWPQLPAPRPAASPSVPVALTLLRQQRLDAEQGAT